jgi:PAS domain S-box-containing protein
MTSGFAKGLGLQFALATLILLIAGIFSYRNVNDSAATVKRLEDTYRVLHGIDRALALIKDAESGQQGYLLTGNATYLNPYQAARTRLDREIESLAELTASNPRQQQRVAELRPLATAKLAELQQTIELHRDGKTNAALEIVSAGEGKRLMREIRGVIAQMEEEEDSLLGRVSSSNALGALQAFAAATVANLILMVFAFRFVMRELGERRRSETALARLASIVEYSEDAIISHELDGKITSWNAGAERLYGYRANEVIGKPISVIVPPERTAQMLEVLEQIRRGQQVAACETVDKRKDGAPIPVSLSVSPIKDGSGVITGVSAIVRDISERKRAEAALMQRTRDLEAAQAWLSSTADFAAALNQAGMLDTYQAALACINRVAEIPLAAVYDSADGEAPVCRCAVGVDPLPLETRLLTGAGLPATVIQTGRFQIVNGPFHDHELRLRFGLGDAMIRSVAGWPILFQNRCIGALVTAHLAPLGDERHAFLHAALGQLAVRMHGFQVEQQRLKLFTDLQAQSKALEKARHEADRSSRVKSEFLTNMSHELRTPMNSIMGFTRRLLKKLGSTLPERELDALQTVDRNAKHLLTLINNILDLSKIEAGKVEVHRTHFDLGTVIREAADQTASLVDGKPVELKLDLPGDAVPIAADRVMLAQVVVNLLSNGIKFTERGSVTIALDVAHDGRLGLVARIAVRDTGVGIKPEDRSRLFQEFTQLDAGAGGRVGGTGLGLVISARFVQLHGGRIDVAGEYGKGTEFTVLLPLSGPNISEPRTLDLADGHPKTNGAAASHTVSQTSLRFDSAVMRPVESAHLGGALCAAVPEPLGRGATILCVDDEPDVLKFLQFTFEDVGYKVILAADHDVALEAASRWQPDLICLDLCMPEKDGYAVLKALRENPDLARVPVVVLSISREEARALAAGARCYLAKPVESEDLVTTVRELLAIENGSALIVEDDPDTRRLLSLTLTEHGFHVRSAANGREALDRLTEATPDAIVLDLIMPVLDGFTFLDHVQLDPVWSKIPVVILTSKTLDPAEIARLNERGAAILTKGRRDTELVVDAILRCVRPERCPSAAGSAL